MSDLKVKDIVELHDETDPLDTYQGKWAVCLFKNGAMYYSTLTYPTEAVAQKDIDGDTQNIRDDPRAHQFHSTVGAIRCNVLVDTMFPIPIGD